MSYEITVYGATGFTGGQAARYLAQRGVKLCVAGRNEAKLRALADELGAGYMVAEAHDSAALARLVSETRVVASTAGPYSAYGSALVEACVARKTHYCDITGETPWVRDMIDRHHQRAEADGTRIVPCSGYDSCPSDLGTLLIVEALRQRGETTRRVHGLHTIKGGGFNGGTLASVRYIDERKRDFGNTYLLSPGFTPTAEQSRESRDFRGVEKRYGRWLAPFLMAATNTRVVRRSALLDANYGPNFTFNEYWSAKRALEAHVMRLALGLAMGPLNKFLVSLGPKPGEGPSEATMNKGAFRSRFYGEGDRGTQMVAEVSGQGDAGNRATTTFLCESALALARDKLPARGGVLTPATAIGNVLIERLRAAGMTMSVSQS